MRARVPRSRSATMGSVATIPKREMRNNICEVLRRAEAGERLTITVDGRPVAELGPLRSAPTAATQEDLDAIFAQPVDPTWVEEILADREAERAGDLDPPA